MVFICDLRSKAIDLKEINEHIAYQINHALSPWWMTSSEGGRCLVMVDDVYWMMSSDGGWRLVIVDDVYWWWMMSSDGGWCLFMSNDVYWYWMMSADGGRCLVKVIDVWWCWMMSRHEEWCVIMMLIYGGRLFQILLTGRANKQGKSQIHEHHCYKTCAFLL